MLPPEAQQAHLDIGWGGSRCMSVPGKKGTSTQKFPVVFTLLTKQNELKE